MGADLRAGASTQRCATTGVRSVHVQALAHPPPHQLVGAIVETDCCALLLAAVRGELTGAVARWSWWTRDAPGPLGPPMCTCRYPEGTAGALDVHGLRHTFATELANSEVDIYTLMNLLGHESMVTSQRYVTAAGSQTTQAAASNRLYTLPD
jgi:hypothetical protein